MSQDEINPIREKFIRLFTGFKGKFTDWMIYETLEGAMLGLFDFFTPEQIYEAIQHDISIWNTPWYDFEEFRYKLQLIVQDPRIIKYKDEFNAENIILWLAEKNARPLLASLIVNTPNGLRWLEKQVEELKEGLTNSIEVETYAEPGQPEN